MSSVGDNQAGNGHHRSDSHGAGDASQQRQPALLRIVNYMSSNKIEALLWFTRLFTLYYTICFFLPLFGGSSYSFYQKVLLSSAASNALRLHQRVPNFELSRVYLTQLSTEDSAHYLFYCLIFIIAGSQVTMCVLPLFLYAVLHTQTYAKQLLDQVGVDSLQAIRSLLTNLGGRQTSLLRFIAGSEILLMVVLIFMLFTGQGSLVLPFMYYRFLSLRYGSRRNPYCKHLFNELRVGVESICNKPRCPRFIRTVCSQAVKFLSSLAPMS